jgi:hypothetical protein
MGKLLAIESIGAKAFAFCILNVTRTSETLRAERSEFDLGERTWIIPPQRMKKGTGNTEANPWPLRLARSKAWSSNWLGSGLLKA